VDDVDTLNLVLLAVRVSAGITLALHGYQKFFMGGRIPGTSRWFESLGMRPGRLHALTAACTEISCGIGFAVGLLTPLTAAGFVGIMFVAAWTHKGHFFVFKDGWEYNLVLAVLAVLVAVTGPGRWSLDNALDIADDLDGTTGLLISLVGLLASIALLAVFWKPPAKADEAAT
jgi:putative oxidoreductase